MSDGSLSRIADGEVEGKPKLGRGFCGREVGAGRGGGDWWIFVDLREIGGGRTFGVKLSALERAVPFLVGGLPRGRLVASTSSCLFDLRGLWAWFCTLWLLGCFTRDILLFLVWF